MSLPESWSDEDFQQRCFKLESTLFNPEEWWEYAIEDRVKVDYHAVRYGVVMKARARPQRDFPAHDVCIGSTSRSKQSSTHQPKTFSRACGIWNSDRSGTSISETGGLFALGSGKIRHRTGRSAVMRVCFCSVFFSGIRIRVCVDRWSAS